MHTELGFGFLRYQSAFERLSVIHSSRSSGLFCQRLDCVWITSADMGGTLQIRVKLGFAFHKILDKDTNLAQLLGGET